jgi:hypothetical protein
MFHPLITDLQSLSDAQVEDKISNLQRKYFQTYNLDLKNQISMTLDMYKEELKHRRFLAVQKFKEQNSNNDLDNLINVN